MKASETGSSVKKRDTKYNCSATSTISVQSKNQDPLTGNINKNNNYGDDMDDGGSNVSKTTIKEVWSMNISIM